MVAKLIRLTHKIAIQLHLVAESCTIFSYRSRLQVRKLLDTPSNIIFPSTTRSSEWTLVFRFSNPNILSTSNHSHACYMPYHLNLLHLITLIILVFGEVYKIFAMNPPPSIR
jgi:hypothetical protein